MNSFSRIVQLFFTSIALVGPLHAFAEDPTPQNAPEQPAPFFDSDAVKQTIHQVVKTAPKQDAKSQPPANNKPMGITFVSTDPQSHLTPPDERAKVRVNSEAPGPFIGMADAYLNNDISTAKLYARQFVRYLSDVMFTAKDLTRLIGEAMIEEGQMDEESWVGVEQYLDYQFSLSRKEIDSPIKPNHEDVLKRMKADPQGEVEIYYFFTLNCSWCRKMAPDVERLWRLTNTDRKMKMVALTLGPQPKEWIDSYRQYFGMTVPIYDGAEVAKRFRVGFVPAIVVVTPNNQLAYLRTGQQDFVRLYEFVRTAQGQSTELTRTAERLLGTPIGEHASTQKAVYTKSFNNTSDDPALLSASMSEPSVGATTIERF